MAYTKVKDRTKENPFLSGGFALSGDKFPDSPTIKQAPAKTSVTTPAISEKGISSPFRYKPVQRFEIGEGLKPAQVLPGPRISTLEKIKEGIPYETIPVGGVEKPAGVEIAKKVISKQYTPVGIRVKLPFIQKGFTLPDDMVEDLTKDMIQFPEKFLKSIAYNKMTPDQKEAFKIKDETKIIQSPLYQKDYKEGLDAGLSPLESFVLTGISVAADASIFFDFIGKPLLKTIVKIPVTRKAVDSLTRDEIIQVTRSKEFGGKIAKEKTAAFIKAKEIYGDDLLKILKQKGNKIDVEMAEGKTLGQWMREQQPGLSIKDVTRDNASEALTKFTKHRNILPTEKKIALELITKIEKGTEDMDVVLDFLQENTDFKVKPVESIQKEITKAKADKLSFDEFKNKNLVYHGSVEPLEKFDKRGAFFTDDMMNAEGYGGGENLYEGYLNMKNPLVIDAKGRHYADLKTPYGESTQEIVGKVDSKKYDGVIFKNINDSFADDVDIIGTDTIMYPFNANKSFINESQLKQLWDKGTDTIESTIKKAKAEGKSFDEWVKAKMVDKNGDTFVYKNKTPEKAYKFADDGYKIKKEDLVKEYMESDQFVSAESVGKVGHIYSETSSSYLVLKPQTKSQLKQLWDKEAYGVAGGVQEEAGALAGFTAGKMVGRGKGRKVSSEIYKQNRIIKRSVKAVIKQDVNAMVDNIKLGSDKYLGAISTRLANINPELKRSIRTFEFNIRKKTLDDTKEVKPLLEATKKMSKEDYLDFDLARKNGDSEKIHELVTKYKIEKEYSATRKTLNNLYKRAEDVGYDIGYRENYHPRIIKDKVGFIKHFREGEDWGAVDQAIKAKENALQRVLNEDEKIQLINTMIRGYAQNNITLSEIGNMKTREIDVVDAKLNQYYQDANASLVSYINKSNEAVEARRFFGKGRFNEEVDINDSIGAYVLDLIATGKITPSQEILVSDMLKARFNAISTRGVISVYKNLSYVDTMGSPTSAITQIGDLSWSLYKAGFVRTAKNVIKAGAGKSKIKREDIGIENIASEFDDPSKSAKAVSKVFKLTGLEKIDAVGKETLINSVIEKYQNWAEKGDKRLNKALEPVFGADKTEILADLESGEITENVKLLAFNELLDMQPVALSEMPQKYLTGGNGRIFYMLKTFTLKQFDIYRREIFEQLGNKGTRVQGIKNLIRLLSSFIVMNATADEIKDFMLGRKTSLKDRTVDNILRAVGFSKYLTWKVRTEGVGSAAARQILPPFKFIDSVSKDITKGIENGTETVQSIPLVGKLYYWWFGKGAYKNKDKKTESRLEEFENRIEKAQSKSKLKEYEDRIKKIQE